MRAYEITNEQLNEVDLKKLKGAAAAGLIGASLALAPAPTQQDIVPEPTTAQEVETIELSKELSSLPVAQKKQLFFDTIAPLVKQANATILKQREKIQSTKDKEWLTTMFKRYRVDNVDDLLKKVDVIPASLVIAQAAIESGWGTSRFAQQGNALFGQRDYSGAGIKPQGASGFTVAKFSSLSDSIKSYMFNLNKHNAYNDFRTKRAGMRQSNKPLDSLNLVTGLLKYSERGQAYVNDVSSIIKFNKLKQYDAL